MKTPRTKHSDPYRTTLVDVATEDWLVGKVIDERYRIESVLGEGGMGRVYEATDTAFHRRLVLKTLLPGLAEDKTAWPRFLREARAAADLGSPHIVSVVEFGNLEDGRSYYLMELADGVSLDHTLDELDAPLPVDRALRIARGITRALEAAHAAQIVHRDLKPDNVILVVQNGRPDFPKIVDFGLALMMNAAVRITGRGEMVGSPYYMSPEQCADAAVDGRADIYALGVILFEMLTLELPHDDDQMVKVLSAKLTTEPPVPSSKGVELPPEVDALVLKCLALKPQDRYANATELGEALDELIGPEQARVGFTAAPGFTRATPEPTPPPRASTPEPPPREPTPPPTSTPAPEPPRESLAPAPPMRGNTALLMVVIFVLAAGLAALVTWLVG